MRISIALALLMLSAPPTRANDYATRMLAATYKVFNQDSTATGFFVTPPPGVVLPPKNVFLVTAGHVFERMKGEHALIVLRKPQPDGTYLRQDFDVKVREAGKPLWFKHPTEDVAALSVELPDGSNVQPIEFDSLADETALKTSQVHIGSEILMLGFPMGVEANGAGFPIARHVTISSYPLLPIQLQKHSWPTSPPSAAIAVAPFSRPPPPSLALTTPFH